MTAAALLLHVAVAAGLWVGLYDLNCWAFEAFMVSPLIAWVFLPAAVRLLVVLLGGWPGALGLGLGTLITNGPVFGALSLQSIALAILVPLGQIAAVRATGALLKVPTTLLGLTPTALVVLALASAACSVALNTLVFRLYGVAPAAAWEVLAMFVGDLVGTLIVLYLIRALIAAWDWTRRDRSAA